MGKKRKGAIKSPGKTAAINGWTPGRYSAMHECKSVMLVSESTLYAGPLGKLHTVPNCGLVLSLTGHLPTVPPLVTANAAAASGVDLKLLGNSAPVPVLAIHWEDGGAYGLSREWWLLLLAEIGKLPPGINAMVGCVGGHGRTGTALAILGCLGGIVQLSDDPVQWVRDVYEQDAVETWEQLEYIERITGHNVHVLPSWEKSISALPDPDPLDADTRGSLGLVEPRGYGSYHL